MAEVANVKLCDGKYQFIIHDDAQRSEAYRYGERWKAGEDLLNMSKSYAALVLRVAELEASRETSPEIASMAGRILAAGNPLDNDQVFLALIEEIAAANSGHEAKQALRTMFGPYFDNMLSLAGSCLSQKEA
jgi:hypothetical protein